MRDSFEKNKKGILLMACASLCVCLGQLFWKLSGTQTLWWLLPGFALYGLGALVMLAAYRYGSVSVLQPVLALNYVLTVVLAAAVLREDISPLRIAGIVCVAVIFKDSILGLTAGITLSSNALIRIGDWIEVPGANADGEVIDIALTTVRVQNWDNTITTIPAYDLIAKPFKNWRGMSDSGGRRIKRAILIDLDSVRFADLPDLERWTEIDLIRDYLAKKIREARAYNAEHPSATASIVNARKLTNIGTFREYLNQWLDNNPDINQEMTHMVRQLQPGPTGLPLEIYCFSVQQSWIPYEEVQANIFDHVYAVMPLFGLKAFEYAGTLVPEQ